MKALLVNGNLMISHLKLNRRWCTSDETSINIDICSGLVEPMFRLAFLIESIAEGRAEASVVSVAGAGVDLGSVPGSDQCFVIALQAS